MNIVHDFPRRVRVIENTWIPMRDGVRLAARLWLPEDAPEAPVPALLEYIPYRKRDHTRWRDQPMHHYFAGHGYASLRVDVRGSGDSGGRLADEYSPEELDDALEVLRWIAAQEWCTGRIGMFGKSWGGINALQIAARRPPELGAIITVCSTADRYAGDAHYMGGCLLHENLRWGALLFTYNALPPDPEIAGDDWRALWRERLERAPLFPALWLRHQRRDAYWRRGSVNEDYAAITCPVWAVSGWADAYASTVPEILARLSGERAGLVGPWAHLYPHNGRPRPAIGWLDEALRWWDRWLRDTPANPEAAYRVWLQEHRRAVPGAERPGRWIAESMWPSPRVQPRRWHFGAGLLAAAPANAPPLTHRSPLDVGAAAGNWCGFGDSDGPGDQRDDDAASLVFDSAPLAAALEILGAPSVTLRVAFDAIGGQLAVRLCDVAPDGDSTRVSYALLNLTHRTSDDAPAPLERGQAGDIRLQLNHCAHHFAAGHRLRVAISTSYWPIAWPAAERATLTLFPSESSLELPVRPASEGDAALRPFGPPASAPPAPETELDPSGVTFERTRDASGAQVQRVAFEMAGDRPALTRLDDVNLVRGHGIEETLSIHPNDPLSARAELRHEVRTSRGGWSVRIETRVAMSADAEHFHIEATLRAWEGERQVTDRVWDEWIARDLV